MSQQRPLVMGWVREQVSHIPLRLRSPSLLTKARTGRSHMRLSLAARHPVRLATRSFQARTRSVATMAQGAPVYDIAVKGWPQTNTLGDCEWLDRPARPPARLCLLLEAGPSNSSSV